MPQEDVVINWELQSGGGLDQEIWPESRRFGVCKNGEEEIEVLLSGDDVRLRWLSDYGHGSPQGRLWIPRKLVEEISRFLDGPEYNGVKQ